MHVLKYLNLWLNLESNKKPTACLSSPIVKGSVPLWANSYQTGSFHSTAAGYRDLFKMRLAKYELSQSVSGLSLL